nr:MAG TPA: hypothetical protein [Caudoviricetes sp.]
MSSWQDPYEVSTSGRTLTQSPSLLVRSFGRTSFRASLRIRSGRASTVTGCAKVQSTLRMWSYGYDEVELKAVKTFYVVRH